MPTSINGLKNITINKVQNQEVFKYMKEHGLVNENEIYIIEETNAILSVPMNLTEEEKAQVRENIGVDYIDIGNVTLEKEGLMTPELLSKLNSIQEGANRYTLPEAGANLGGVKSGGDVTINNGTIIVNEATHADSADVATKDGNGNIIVDTYETKADSTNKLNEAKAYTNEKISDHNHDSDYDEKGAADTALSSANSYTDTKVSNLASTSSVNTSITTHNTATDAHGDIRTLISKLSEAVNKFLDVDDTTTDQLSEVLTLINNNKGTLTSLTSSKINVSDIVNDLVTNSNSKVLSASQGVAIKALIDALQSELDTHDANTTKHVTSTERTNWNAAKTHADSAHAPSNAEKNQNAFSNIKVGDTTIAADTVTDTLELVGSNVTITPDATNDKVTIGVANGSTTVKGLVQLTDSTSSTSTTTAATPNSVKSAYDLANTAKTNAATAQTRADSAYALAESKADNLSDLGVTATAAELNYVDGVTSSIQTQLNDRIPFDNTNTISLKSGDDLNNFKTPGIYISGSSTVSSGITNAPTTSSGFKLFVIDGYISGRVTQLATVNNNNLFYRQFNGTSWGDWDTLATKAGLDNKEAKGTASTLINRTTAVNAADTNYTTYMARGTSLNSAETNPTVNGTIAWTYE